MKRTVLAILLATTAATAQAEIIAQMPNDAGGKIQLSDERCAGTTDGYAAYSYTRDGTMLEGCWFGDSGDAVYVGWFSASGKALPKLSTKLYPLNAFTRTPAGEALYQQSQPKQQRRSTGTWQ